MKFIHKWITILPVDKPTVEIMVLDPRSRWKNNVLKDISFTYVMWRDILHYIRIFYGQIVKLFFLCVGFKESIITPMGLKAYLKTTQEYWMMLLQICDLPGRFCAKARKGKGNIMGRIYLHGNLLVVSDPRFRYRGRGSEQLQRIVRMMGGK